MSQLQNTVCITLLSGIPAAGKTTLANLFCEFIDSIPFDLEVANQKGRLRVLHIAYDKLIPEDIDFTEAANLSTWKQYRDQIHVCLDDVLDSILSEDVSLHDAISRVQENEAPDHGNQYERCVRNNFCEMLRHQLGERTSSTSPLATVFLVDDNFFYRSMRYEYYQLARKYSIGFCQVHIACPVNIAVTRNAKRPTPISMETYKNMLSKIEEPGPNRASWEYNYLIIDGNYEFNHLQLSQMWGSINDALQDPVQPLPEEDVEAKEQSRTASLTSILHQADIILRKCVAESISKVKSSQKTDDRAVDIKSFAAKANRGRTTLLEQIREGAVALPPLDSDLDTTHRRPSKPFESQLQRLYEQFLQSTEKI